jgi:hypothetical protein
MKDANAILSLNIDWNANLDANKNYQMLLQSAKMMLAGLHIGYDILPTQEIESKFSRLTILYGILSEYTFAAGMFNQWKIYSKKYADNFFKDKTVGQTRVMPA